jgi:hypothetical protein
MGVHRARFPGCAAIRQGEGGKMSVQETVEITTDFTEPEIVTYDREELEVLIANTTGFLSENP